MVLRSPSPGQTDELEQLLDPAGHLGPGAAPQPEGVADVAGHALVREQLAVLEHQREAAPVGGYGGQVLPVVRDGAGVERLEAGDGTEQGRLAAAGRAEHGQHLPGGQVEADVVHRGRWRGPSKRTVRSRTVSTSERSHGPEPEAFDRGHHGHGEQPEHDGRGERHAEVRAPRAGHQLVDHHRQRRPVRAGQEAGRPELAERDREREPGRGEQRPPQHRQVDGERTRTGEAPSDAAA